MRICPCTPIYVVTRLVTACLVTGVSSNLDNLALGTQSTRPTFGAYLSAYQLSAYSFFQWNPRTWEPSPAIATSTISRSVRTLPPALRCEPHCEPVDCEPASARQSDGLEIHTMRACPKLRFSTSSPPFRGSRRYLLSFEAINPISRGRHEARVSGVLVVPRSRKFRSVGQVGAVLNRCVVRQTMRAFAE